MKRRPFTGYFVRFCALLISFYPALHLFAQNKLDAGNWKPWVVTNVNDLKLTAPPGKEETAKELAKIRELQSKLTPSQVSLIRYWDAGSPAYHWNRIGYQFTGPELFSKPNGGIFWRSPMAWMNIAIYDATVAAWNLKNKYNRKRPFETDPSIKAKAFTSSSPSFPCEHSVTASAASHVLAYFFPAVGDSLINLARNAGQSRVLAGVQYPSDIDQGWELGKKAAMQVIEKAKMDGFGSPWTGKVPDDPKLWRGPNPVGVQAITIKPLVLESADQFRPGPPPSDFTGEMNEMRNFKQNFYTISEAYKWAALSGLDIWTDLASQKMFEYHIDRNTPEAARIYTLLHVAIHDATIAIMDAKYAYFGIRPDQFDKNYKPLIGFTPPFPGYPSGHATASSAAATVLAYFFPDDADYFKRLAKECAMSRFYAGIHFQTDNTVGIEMGEKLANYIIEKCCKKAGEGILIGYN